MVAHNGVLDKSAYLGSLIFFNDMDPIYITSSQFLAEVLKHVFLKLFIYCLKTGNLKENEKGRLPCLPHFGHGYKFEMGLFARHKRRLSLFAAHWVPRRTG